MTEPTAKDPKFDIQKYRYSLIFMILKFDLIELSNLVSTFCVR